jgi:hypothetical protein
MSWSGARASEQARLEKKRKRETSEQDFQGRGVTWMSIDVTTRRTDVPDRQTREGGGEKEQISALQHLHCSMPESLLAQLRQGKQLLGDKASVFRTILDNGSSRRDWSCLRALGAATAISAFTWKHLDSCFVYPYLIDDGHERHHGREEGDWNIHGVHAHSELLDARHPAQR